MQPLLLKSALQGQKLKIMKNLKVIKPFSGLEVGDILTLTADGKMFEIENHIDGLTVAFSSKFSISVPYAEQLVKEGYLLDVKTSDEKFKNVFDEIDRLLNEYQNDYKTIDEDYAEMPACLKIEKQTVLNNLISVLTYLKNLKK